MHGTSSSGTPRHYRRLLAAASLLVLAGITARMLIGAHVEVGRSQASGEPATKVRHLRRAMAYYVPGNPWVGQAQRELLALARKAEVDGDPTLALSTYRELRSAVLALRGAFNPYADCLPEVNRSIARLARGDAALLHRLEHAPAPRFWWAALGMAGFLIWTVGAALMVLRGLRPDATILARRFWPLAAAVAAGMGLFYLGMSSA